MAEVEVPSIVKDLVEFMAKLNRALIGMDTLANEAFGESSYLQEKISERTINVESLLEIGRHLQKNDIDRDLKQSDLDNLKKELSCDSISIMS